MNIECAKAISTGFMSDPELIWLAEQAAAHQCIAEVGSWTGRSTRAMADNTKGVIWAIDTWEGSTNGDLQDIIAAKGAAWPFEEFRRNMEDCPNVYVQRARSLVAAKSFKPGTFDLVFIDASHDYNSVANDIRAWQGLLRSGGMLAGHDYCPERWPGVKRAVDELCPDRRTMEPNNGDRSIWWTLR
jgi:predicted O-methyltransferase YrrM